MSSRRFVYLMLEETGRRQSAFTLRKIDMSRFFFSPRPPPMPPPFAAGAAPHDMVEYGSLPASPDMTFYPPLLRLLPSQMDFALLGGSNRHKVVATDRTGRAVLYDPDQHSVRTLPSLSVPKDHPVSLAVGDTDIYTLDLLPGKVRLDDGYFEGLIYGEDMSLLQDWRCRPLPPPPYTCKPDYSFSACFVDSYTVVGDKDIWISKDGPGTYCFDTARSRWSKAGDWSLPFTGPAKYVPEHGLWFGFSHVDNLSAWDLTSAWGHQEPVLRSLLPREYTPPDDALQFVGSFLVHLGSSKFCIARFLETDEDRYDGTELFMVLTAVEVERRDDDGGAVDDAYDGGGLRLVKHRSEMYKLPCEIMYWVL